MQDTKIPAILILQIFNWNPSHKKPGYNPTVNTARTYEIGKGKKKTNDIVRSDTTNYLGHIMFTIAAQNGIKLSEHINDKGKMSPELSKLVQRVLKNPESKKILGQKPVKKVKKPLK